jgi:hypothetical protein
VLGSATHRTQQAPPAAATRRLRVTADHVKSSHAAYLPSIWLHDPHTNVAAWHKALRDTITDEQRAAVLRIKDVWHRHPDYPDKISGLEIYSAVLNHGVRTAPQFAAWLAEHGLLQPKASGDGH